MKFPPRKKNSPWNLRLWVPCSGMTGTKTISNYDGIGSYIHEIFKKKICKWETCWFQFTKWCWQRKAPFLRKGRPRIFDQTCNPKNYGSEQYVSEGAIELIVYKFYIYQTYWNKYNFISDLYLSWQRHLKLENFFGVALTKYKTLVMQNFSSYGQ